MLCAVYCSEFSRFCTINLFFSPVQMRKPFNSLVAPRVTKTKHDSKQLRKNSKIAKYNNVSKINCRANRIVQSRDDDASENYVNRQRRSFNGQTRATLPCGGLRCFSSHRLSFAFAITRMTFAAQKSGFLAGER